jgi:hypothetical protein
VDQSGRAYPLVVTQIRNPKLFKLLSERVFQKGSMHLYESLMGPLFIAETAWKDAILEGENEFSSFVGPTNIDSKTGEYLRPFHLWGVLRPEIYPMKSFEPETRSRSGGGGVHFNVSRDALGVTLKMLDHQDRLIGSLVLLGHRGEVTLSNIKINSANQENVSMLLEEAARISLFKRGSGRIFIPRVGDKKILKAALELFDLPSLFVARTRFDRSIRNVRQSDGVLTENREEVLRLLESTSQTVDVCGSLPPALRREGVYDNAGAIFPQRQLPYVELRKNEIRGFDNFRIVSGGEIVGSMIVKVLADVIIILKIEVNSEPQNHRRKGYGSAAIMHFAKLASRILFPRQNLSGIRLPLERRNIINPWIYQHAIQNIFEEGTVELVEVGTEWALYEEFRSSDWTQAVRQGDPRYEFLTSNENINGAGDYISRFHLRGQLRKSVSLSAEMDYMGNVPLNSLLFIGAGFPLDPFWGIALALVVGVAFLYHERLFNWMGSKIAPLQERVREKIGRSSKLSPYPSATIRGHAHPPLKALPLSEEDASKIAGEIAQDLGLGILQSEDFSVGEKNFRVGYDLGARFERVGSLFYVNADLWQKNQDYFNNKMKAFPSNIIVLPLETYNMPRKSFLSPHATLLIAQMMRMDLEGKTVIDLGCGQGTLSLTALKLGAQRVIGIDKFRNGNRTLFEAQGIHLGDISDNPESYDILFVKGRIQKECPPWLQPHLDGSKILLANVGPSYEDYFEMVPAWSEFPTIDVWLDGGHFSSTIADATKDFIGLAHGWQVTETWKGLLNGDSPQAAPAAFVAKRVPPTEATDNTQINFQREQVSPSESIRSVNIQSFIKMVEKIILILSRLFGLSSLMLPPSLKIVPEPSPNNYLSRTSKNEREREKPLVNFDERPVRFGLLGEVYAQYAEQARQILNPGGGDYTILYGGAGADVSNALLLSHFTRAFFVSPNPGLTIDDLNQLRERGIQPSSDYAREKFKDGYADGGHFIGKQQWLCSLATELQGMGIAPSSVETFQWNRRRGIRFQWKAPNESSPRKREIIFIDEDITQPDDYADVLNERFDLYLQRAGAMIPWQYQDNNCFINTITRSMNRGALFATDDFAMDFNGTFVDLTGFFPLARPVIHVPKEHQYLLQAIADRYKNESERDAAIRRNEGYGLLLRIRPLEPSPGADAIPLSETEQMLNALDQPRLRDTSAALARYFGLSGSVAELGVFNSDSAQGLLQEGVARVYNQDPLLKSSFEIENGVHTVPGHVTSLSSDLGLQSMDAILFNKSLPRLIKGKEAKTSSFGRHWADQNPSEDMDIGFELDALSKTIEEANRTLKNGGRLLLVFSPSTVDFIDNQWHFFGWEVKDLLEGRGFDRYQAFVSKRGVVAVSAVANHRRQNN